MVSLKMDLHFVPTKNTWKSFSVSKYVLRLRCHGYRLQDRRVFTKEAKAWRSAGFQYLLSLAAQPIGSMYGIFTYIWLIFMVNVGKYTIHGSYGQGFVG